MTMPSAFGLPIDNRRVDELIRLCRHHNVFPLFLNHHYPAISEHPVSQFLATLVPEVAALLRGLTRDELAALVEAMPDGPHVSVRVDQPRNCDDALDLERIALGWVHWRMRDEYFSLADVVHPEKVESAVLERFPELRDRFDDDGLLLMTKDMVLWDGGIFYQDQVLHYHQGLRRGFSSNPNFDFLGRFARYLERSKDRNSFRIGIDHRRIMHRSFYEQIMEMDGWFGASLDRTRLDDPLEVGLTVLGRSKPSPLDLFGNLVRTEVLRSVNAEVKTFEIEELADISEAHGNYVVNRYVHAERDMKKAVFRHFDGAIKIYLKDRYSERLERNLPDKNSYKKLKLFRIDGEVETEPWIDLTMFFFKGNEMVLEYFDPEQFQARFSVQIARYQELKARRKL